MTIPVPQSLPPAVSLWVDGVRYADGQPGEPDTMPVALTDLAVTWGRSDTVDQPQPASLSFVVLDVGGGERFADRLHVGARVSVRADAVIYPPPTESVVIDAGFEAAAAGSVPSVLASNAGVVVSAARAAAGVHSARVRPADPGRGVRVIFPPAPLAVDQPAAWDAIPRTAAGQEWGYGAAVWLPKYLADVSRASVRPALFPRPWGPATVVDVPAPAGAPDGAGWVTYAGTFQPPADVWVGVAVDVYPTGPAWVDVPADLAWSDLPAPAPSWLDLADTFVDSLSVLAPAAGAARAGSVFDGRITDMIARYDIDIGGTVVDVIGQDDTAELANRFVGETPWAAESLASRFGKIVTGSGQPTAYIVDPGPGALQVTYRDVDAQPALGLLQELASSAGGVLWAASSTAVGPYLWLEDTTTRPALLKLTRGPDLIVVIVPADAAADGITVSACDILLEPVRWVVDSTDSATRIDVGWLEQVNDAGTIKPAARTVTLINPDAERWTGRRRVGLQTQLTTSAAASTVGAAVLARLSADGWRVSSLTWRAELDDPLSPAGLAAVMSVLDGTTRPGLPIMLTDLPDWSPIPAGHDVPLFLEGGRLSNTDGAWQLELITSSAKSQGRGVRWNELPAAWTWQQFSPDISWNDLYGTGV